MVRKYCRFNPKSVDGKSDSEHYFSAMGCNFRVF